jgi:hypothetical protein
LTTEQCDLIHVNVINIHTSEAVMPIVAKLDELGRGAWVALAILGWLFWWPVGLAIGAFVLGSGRMSCWNHHSVARWQGKMERAGRDWWASPRSSGNRAFDEYRSETLRRLEDEQQEFKEFLQRLRMAKDKAEFDQFMAERRNRPTPPASQEG